MVWIPSPPRSALYTQPRTDEDTRLTVFVSLGIDLTITDSDDEKRLKVAIGEPPDDTTLAVNVFDVGGDNVLPQDLGAFFPDLTVWERVI